MTPAELLAGLATGPDYLLQDFDWVNRRGLIVRIDEDSLRRAPFLDHRALKPGTTRAWLPRSPCCWSKVPSCGPRCRPTTSSTLATAAPPWSRGSWRSWVPCRCGNP